MRTKGKITSWNGDKGYGFITPLAGGKQVFIHINEFAGRKKQLAVGQIVTYEMATDRQGRKCGVRATLPGEKLRQDNSNNGIASSILIAMTFLVIVAGSVLMKKLPPTILLIYVALSMITFFIYRADKSAARQGKWRTPESTLHLLALTGGWPGALIAQQTLRHKSKKKTFRVIFWMTVLINCGFLAWLFSTEGSVFLNSVLQQIF